MIHDFAITARYVVLVVGPLVFDLDAMIAGGDPLAWKPELGTRIAADPPRPPVADAVGRTPTPSGRGTTPTPSTTATSSTSTSRAVERPAMVLPGADQRAGDRAASPGRRSTRPPARSTLHHLDDHVPRVPAHRRPPHRAAPPLRRRGRALRPTPAAPGEHDLLHRYDMDAGTSVHFDAHAAIGEADLRPPDRRHRRARRLLPHLRHRPRRRPHVAARSSTPPTWPPAAARAACPGGSPTACTATGSPPADSAEPRCDTSTSAGDGADGAFGV